MPELGIEKNFDAVPNKNLFRVFTHVICAEQQTRGGDYPPPWSGIDGIYVSRVLQTKKARVGWWKSRFQRPGGNIGRGVLTDHRDAVAVFVQANDVKTRIHLPA